MNPTTSFSKHCLRAMVLIWIILMLPLNGQEFPESALELPARISLNGPWQYTPGNLAPANYYQPEVDDRHWPEMQIPNNWFLQGVDHAGVMWFRKHFRLDAGKQRKKSRQLTELVFEGVDYSADVWLNGHYLGFHEGYFQTFSFDVSRFLNPDGENLLAVRVNSPFEAPGSDWSLRKRLVKGIFSHHDTRPGGAWSERGQEQNTGGIWAPVYLRITREMRLDSLRITPILDPENNRATARIQLRVFSSRRKSAKVQFKALLQPHNFSGQPDQTIQINHEVVLKQGMNTVGLNIPVENPELWWTWEHGRPNLYHLQVTLLSDDRQLDRRESVFGFRSITLDAVDNVWRLNGRRIFLRGTNYIATQWLAEMNREKYAFDIQLMKRANINVVRVHAHITGREFYSECDAAGLMIWQDFPLQWGYEDSEAFKRSAARQAGEMIRQLYNHPSIIAWSLHNEPPWDADWMVYKYGSYDPEQNKALDDFLFDAVLGLDKTRYLHKYSATGEHHWMGWYSGSWLDHAAKTKTAMITEFGAQALPGLDALRRIFTEAELWPDNDKEWQKWNYHNFQRHETFNMAKVEMGNDIESFIENTQRYQARLTQLAAESYRRQRYQPVNSIFQFMFVEDWPSINWGVVDYWRDPKPGYQALARAYQPVLPSIDWKKERWSQNENIEIDLWAINDLYIEYKNATMVYIIRNAADVIATEKIHLDIPPDSGRKIVSIQKKDMVPGQYTLITTLYTQDQRMLGQNQFTFEVVQAIAGN